MLYAIFFLLLIVFFPILSLVLGVGVVALVATYWWVILIIVALPVVIKVLDKPYQSSNADTKPNNPTPKSEIDSKEIRKPYAGDASLNNDSYIIFLTRKYAIEKNDVLGQYICRDKLFPSLDDVLNFADELEIRQKTMSDAEIKAQALSLEAKEYGVTFDGEKYCYQTYSYDKLEDAIRYAKLQRK